METAMALKDLSKDELLDLVLNVRPLIRSALGEGEDFEEKGEVHGRCRDCREEALRRKSRRIRAGLRCLRGLGTALGAGGEDR